MFSPEEIAVLKAQSDAIPEQLHRNMRVFPGETTPVLLAGASYLGIWLEHNQDVYFAADDICPCTAWQSQEIFMKYQRADGLLPAAVKCDPFVVRYAQLQTVWPFARCAFEVAKKCDRPEEDFARIYHAGCRYDEFLLKNRNHSGTGLVEMFCEFDTGHDCSPRVCDGGLPRACADGNAANMPDLSCMPLIAADLSAMRFGALEALAELAEHLGKTREAALHREQAEELKAQMLKLLYDPEDEFFYDLAPTGWRKYRTEHMTRLFLNGVVDQAMFDRIYDRYFAPGREFFTAYPYPAVSPQDPAFCKDLPPNCWGSNTQMLTLLRALLWMPRYGREGDLREIMRRFLRSYCDNFNCYSQELNPFTGEPIAGEGNYTPAMLFFRAACRTPGVLA